MRSGDRLVDTGRDSTGSQILLGWYGVSILVVFRHANARFNLLANKMAFAQITSGNSQALQLNP